MFKNKGEKNMASNYNLKRQIAAHHQELGGAHRIHMGGKTLSMNKSGVAEDLIQMLPEKDRENLTEHISKEIDNTFEKMGLGLKDFDKVPQFIESKMKEVKEKPKEEPKKEIEIKVESKPVIEDKPKVTGIKTKKKVK
jgi:hypothetical protein